MLALGLGVFATATFVMAPAAWIANAEYVWMRLGELRSLAHEVDPLRVTDNSGAGLKLLGGVVIAALIGRASGIDPPALAAAGSALALPCSSPPCS